MIIKLDLSCLNENVKSAIANSEEIKSSVIDRSSSAPSTPTISASVVANQHAYNAVITLDYKKESLVDFKIILQDILARNHLDELMIAEDTEVENTVTILRQGDLEQFGVYLCKHCGTVFKSTDEKVLRERIHYFI